jgi:LPS sulfotransferase NodH
LADALTATGQAGSPDEFFDVDPNNEQNWVNRFRIPVGASYIDHLQAATRTRNGVFGFKLHWHQMPALAAACWNFGPKPKA